MGASQLLSSGWFTIEVFRAKPQKKKDYSVNITYTARI